MINKATLIHILKQEGIHDPMVLEAMAKVPRERFVTEAMRTHAYDNRPLPIDCAQTISQPYIVARMTELLLEYSPQNVLEIGTGSGYQAAVLAECVLDIYTVERYATLYEQAKARLAPYTNVHCFHADGFLGWPAGAPYDGVIITAAVSGLPAAIKEQMADLSVAVYPEAVNEEMQQLIQIVKEGSQYHRVVHEPVRFVPMIKNLAD